MATPRRAICERCRAKKRGCSRTKPTCERCEHEGLVCVYPEASLPEVRRLPTPVALNMGKKDNTARRNALDEPVIEGGMENTMALDDTGKKLHNNPQLGLTPRATDDPNRAKAIDTSPAPAFDMPTFDLRASLEAQARAAIQPNPAFFTPRPSSIPVPTTTPIPTPVVPTAVVPGKRTHASAFDAGNRFALLDSSLPSKAKKPSRGVERPQTPQATSIAPKLPQKAMLPQQVTTQRPSHEPTPRPAPNQAITFPSHPIKGLPRHLVEEYYLLCRRVYETCNFPAGGVQWETSDPKIAELRSLTREIVELAKQRMAYPQLMAGLAKLSNTVDLFIGVYGRLWASMQSLKNLRECIEDLEG